MGGLESLSHRETISLSATGPNLHLKRFDSKGSGAVKAAVLASKDADEFFKLALDQAASVNMIPSLECLSQIGLRLCMYGIKS